MKTLNAKGLYIVSIYVLQIKAYTQVNGKWLWDFIQYYMRCAVWHYNL